MQRDIIDLLRDTKERVERARKAIKSAIGEDYSPTQIPTVVTAGGKLVSSQSTVFISYSHKNENEKDKLVSHLNVLGKDGLINLWSDDQISAGGDWEREITDAMEIAKVAILLISVDYLSSDFILKKEVPTLLERREKEGLIVFPVIARTCAWESIDWLNRMDVRPKNRKAIWRAGRRRVDGDLTDIAIEIATIIKRKF